MLSSCNYLVFVLSIFVSFSLSYLFVVQRHHVAANGYHNNRDVNSPPHNDSDYKYGRFDASALHIAHALKQTELQKAYNKRREKPIDYYLVSSFTFFGCFYFLFCNRRIRSEQHKTKIQKKFCKSLWARPTSMIVCASFCFCSIFWVFRVLVQRRDDAFIYERQQKRCRQSRHHHVNLLIFFLPLLALKTVANAKQKTANDKRNWNSAE